MRAEIVHDDDVAGFQLRHQHLLDIDAEAFVIDRTIENEGGADTIDPECGGKGHGFPMTEGRVAQQPFAVRRPAPERRHFRLRPGFIDDDGAGRVDPVAMLQPSCRWRATSGRSLSLATNFLYNSALPHVRRSER